MKIPPIVFAVSINIVESGMVEISKRKIQM